MAIISYAPKVASPRIWRPDGAPALWHYLDAPGRTFAGGTGDVADLAGNVRAGTRSNCTLVDGPRGKCLSSSGSGSVTVNVAQPTSTPITLCWWQMIPPSGSSQFAGGGASFFEVYAPFSGSSTLYWDYCYPANRLTTDYTPYFGRWTHVAVTARVGLQAIYLNGQLAASQGLATLPTLGAGSTSPMAGATPGVLMDDFRFYFRALSAAEVARDFADPDWRLRRPVAARSFAFPVPPIAGSGSAAAVATATGSSSLAIRGSAGVLAAATATAAGSLAMVGAAAASALATALATALLALAGSGSAGSVATASASGSIAGVVAGSTAATATAAASGTLRIAGSAAAGSMAAASARLAPAGAPPTTTGSPDPDRTTWAIVAAVPDPDRTVFDLL